MFPVVGRADVVAVKKNLQRLVGELLMLTLQCVGQGGDEAVGVVVMSIGEEEIVLFVLRQTAGLDEDCARRWG